MKKTILMCCILAISACEAQKHTMPEANNENCKNEFIDSLDESIRKEFRGKCFRRGGFEKSQKRGW